MIWSHQWYKISKYSTLDNTCYSIYSSPNFLKIASPQRDNFSVLNIKMLTSLLISGSTYLIEYTSGKQLFLTLCLLRSCHRWCRRWYCVGMSGLRGGFVMGWFVMVRICTWWHDSLIGIILLSISCHYLILRIYSRIMSMWLTV